MLQNFNHALDLNSGKEIFIRHRKLHRDIGYVPPTDTGSLCLAVDSTRTAVPGLFRLLVRRSGTHYQMNSEIRRVMSTASNSSLKQSCSAFTTVTSALEVIFNVMRSINLRFTYLLTYTLHWPNVTVCRRHFNSGLTHPLHPANKTINHRCSSERSLTDFSTIVLSN